MKIWNGKAKRLLKSELVKRGITTGELALVLNQIGLSETKSGIDSKISRGTFSAAFFLQCLHVIGCQGIHLEASYLPGEAGPATENKLTKNADKESKVP